MIPWAKPRFGARERAYVLDALDSTWISGGPYVERFEAAFRSACGAELGLAVSNGTTALELALRGAGIGPGSEVVVPGFSFVAPGNMVIAVGATPVFAEVDPGTWCLTAEAAERCLTSHTRAIIAVHTYGGMCEMQALADLARAKSLVLIEDAAEAAFSRSNGKQAGSWGDLGCFSFQATKTITTGEGGFVVCHDAALEQRMRVIRDHGMRKGHRYWHDEVGMNFRLTNLQAAIGCAQLEALPEIIDERRLMYQRYRAKLDGQEGIRLQRFDASVEPVVWAFAIELDERAFPRGRDGVIAALLEAGIETRPGFYPFTVLPLYQPYVREGLPIAERIGRSVISLPSFPQLTAEEIDRICSELLRLRGA